MTLDRQKLPDPHAYYASRDMKLAGRVGAAWKTTACCFHGGSDSMRINTRTGGYICMSCQVSGGDVLAYEMAVSGDTFVSAARRLGAWITEPNEEGRQFRPSPFPARDALQVLRQETLLAAVAATNVANGVEMLPADLQRLRLASHRITAIAEMYA
jgi:hypothetical protein